MIIRKNYLEQLVKFRDKNIIKVVTGIRRSGKSTLLVQFSEYLVEQGVSSRNIIFINLESAKYDAIRDYHALYDLVGGEISDKNRYYVFIDEIQNVEQFERAVNSLIVDFNIDLYLTGSNAYLLSSEISTLLS
ncbi:MAG: AAA family ATPase, partial [Bacteroidales bacterium]|nr:AAA family ATPase [Bacteroidales bacterium]